MYILLDTRAGQRYYAEDLDEFIDRFPGPSYEHIKGVVERQQSWECKTTGYKILKHKGRRRSDR